MGTVRAFGSVALRKIVVNGRMVSSFWDTCASHTFVSTRLAAEAIALGAPWKKCELPIRQGVLNAGVSRVKVLLDTSTSWNAAVH